VKKCIYLIGSLRNPKIPEIANALAAATGYEVFADWHAAGPSADDHWRDYEKSRNPNVTIKEAVYGEAARHCFEFDKQHLDRSDIVVLVMPAGKSGHLELGYAIGKGKKGYVLFDSEPERYDIMLRFADGLATSLDELVGMLWEGEGKAPLNMSGHRIPNAGDIERMFIGGGRPRSY
jgi:nucleoside 2-deoxyribosyltransferase